MASDLDIRLHDAVSHLTADRTDLLVSLVQCRSLLGKEADAQRLVAKTLDDLGLETDVWEPNIDELRRHPAFCIYPGLEQLTYRDRPIVVGRLPGRGGGRSLILQGHIDVVSAEPHGAWSHDPWGGEIVDGKVYGRGSADMKGGLVAALSAVQALVLSGVRPRGDVVLQSVIDEEAYSNGALACAERGYRADAAIVAEPTDLRLVAGHAGVSHFRIKVEGKSAHPAQKEQGVCAIEKAMLVYRALMGLEADRRARVAHPLFPTRSPVDIVVGTMHAGSWRSTVAGAATLEVRVGFAPGENISEIEAELTERLSALSSRDAWLRDHPPVVERLGYTASAEISTASPFVRAVQDVRAAHGLSDTPILGMPAGCDMQSLIHHANTPTVIWGPGSPDVAHTVDEHIALEEVERATRLYVDTITSWCGVAA